MKLLWKHSLDGKVVAVYPEDLPNSGFRSVYGFLDSVADSLAKDGYKGYRGPVIANELLIDCDSEESAKKVHASLIDNNQSFREYTTGNRGSHFHLPRVREIGVDIPAKDKEYVRSLGAGADLSFYHSVGFYRCIGAKHHRTGKKKELISGFEGNILDLSQIDPVVRPKAAPGVGGQIQSVFTDRALQTLTVPYHAGERHKRYVEIALALNRLNQPIEFAFAYLFNVNLMSEKPIEASECRRILEWAYNERVY